MYNTCGLFSNLSNCRFTTCQIIGSRPVLKLKFHPFVEVRFLPFLGVLFVCLFVCWNKTRKIMLGRL